MAEHSQSHLLRQGLAWGVHLYTALGAVVALLALRAIYLDHPREVFVWMLIATLIDATDGVLARVTQVKKVLPWFDGSKLDDIVDYLNYVVVPAIFLYQGDLLPAQGRLFFASLPLIASAYGFCQAAAKTPDHFFTGFPSYWNILAFYLYAGKTPLWFNGTIVAVLAFFVFVPLRYLYPSRTPSFRLPTILLGLVWLGMLLILLYQLPSPSGFILVLSLFYPLYYTLISFYLDARRVIGKV